jgi:hypothetical protein
MEKIKLTYDQAEGVGEPAWEIDDGDELPVGWLGTVVEAEAEGIGETTLIIIPGISPKHLNGFEAGEMTLVLRRTGDDS